MARILRPQLQLQLVLTLCLSLPCQIYVVLFPCNDCAKLIIQSGIREVIYVSDKYHDTVPIVASRRLLDMAKVGGCVCLSVSAACESACDRKHKGKQAPAALVRH